LGGVGILGRGVGWALAGLVITYTSRQLGGDGILGRGGGWALAGLVSLPTHHDRGGMLQMEGAVAVPHRTHIPRLVYACSVLDLREGLRKAPFFSLN
jgi:hypothetical protein